MNVLVYVNFFVVHVLSKYKRQKRCLNLLKLEKNSFIIPFLWYVSKRKREQSLLVTHSIPRVPVYYSNWGYTPTFLLNRNSIWLSKISNLVGHVVKQCEARSMRNGIRNIYIILIRLLKSRLQLTLQLFFFYGFLLLTLDHVRNIYMAMLKSRLGLIQLKIYRNQRFCYFIDS